MSSLKSIEQRNARVEAEKAWETSWTRRFVIALGTYAIIGGYLSFLNVDGAWLHALVPVIAYMLSTLSLPLIQGFWIKNIYAAKQPE